MRKIIVLLVFIICLTLAVKVEGQSILQQYFNGNKDSLLTEAVQLINMPTPTFKPAKQAVIDPTVLTDLGFEQDYKTEEHYFIARDNKKIFSYKFPKASQSTILLLHGVGSTAWLQNKAAGLLQEATQAEIFAIDFRGHGQSEGKAGDVDYINQYADDLSDIIEAVKKVKPNGKIFIAAHSMGGGVALRYAMANHQQKIDGILLFAPLIGHNSPAIRQAQTAGSDSTEPFMKIHFARIIGLKMLNEIDHHEQDSLPVLFFNLPETMPLRQYSYRANMSMTPDNYADGLKSVKVPMLVFIGDHDEVFAADKLKKAILDNSNGKVYIIQGASHNGIRHNTQVYKLIQNWFLNR